MAVMMMVRFGIGLVCVIFCGIRVIACVLGSMSILCCVLIVPICMVEIAMACGMRRMFVSLTGMVCGCVSGSMIMICVMGIFIRVTVIVGVGRDSPAKDGGNEGDFSFHV